LHPYFEALSNHPLFVTLVISLPTRPEKRQDFLITGKFTVLDKTFDRWPKENELKMGRKLWRDEKEKDGWGKYMYMFYLEDFLQETCNKNHFKKWKYLSPTSKLANETDHAVTKTLIENSYKVWMKVAKWE
jgi:hypothetical protein